MNYEQRTKTDHCRKLEDEQNRGRGAGPRARLEDRTGEREGSGHRGLPAVHRVERSFQGHPRFQHPPRRAEHERAQHRRLHRRDRRGDAQGIFRALRHSRPLRAPPVSEGIRRVDRQESARPRMPLRSSRSFASAKRWPNAKAARWKRFSKRRFAAAWPV